VTSGYLRSHVLCNTIHNSQGIEIINVPMSRWERNYSIPYCGTLFSLQKEGNSAIGNSSINLQDIMISDIIQSQKDKYCMITSTRSSSYSQTQRQRMQWWLPGARRWGNGEMLLCHYNILALQDKLICDNGAVLHT
jgi:hypothetical protein